MSYSRTSELSVKGLADLVKALEAFGTDVATKAIRRAGRKAGELVREQAAESAPWDTGDLSMNMTMKTEFKEGDLLVSVGPGKNEFYGRFLELGTAKLPAQPFLAPALEFQADNALEAFKEEIRRSIKVAERRSKGIAK